MTRSPPPTSILPPRSSDHSPAGLLDKAIRTPACYKRDPNGQLKYIITLSLNGYPSNQISITNQNHIVTIKAIRKEKVQPKETFTTFTREFYLPTNVLPSTLKWNIDLNGVLTIEADAVETNFLPMNPTFFSPTTQRRVNVRLSESSMGENYVRGPEIRSSHTMIHSPPSLTKLKTSLLKSPMMGRYFDPHSPNVRKSQVKFADTVQNVTPNLDTEKPLNGVVLTTPLSPNLSNHRNQPSNDTKSPLRNHLTNHSSANLNRPNKPDKIQIPKTPLYRASGIFNDYSLSSSKYYVQKVRLNPNIQPADISIIRQNCKVIIAAKHSNQIQDLKKPKLPVFSYQYYSEHTIPQGVDLNQLKVRLENGMVTLEAPYVFQNLGLVTPNGQPMLNIKNNGI